MGQSEASSRDGSLSSDQQEWQNREVIYSGTFSELFKSAPSLYRAQLGQLLRAGNRIADHDPLNGYLPRLEARVH